jgi:hypothetical protein
MKFPVGMSPLRLCAVHCTVQYRLSFGRGRLGANITKDERANDPLCVHKPCQLFSLRPQLPISTLQGALLGLLGVFL